MRALLIGHPVEHSLSPAMHDAAFAALGLPHRYELRDVTAERLREAVAGLRADDVLGANVTVPYKEDVARLLDALADDAARIGAVNTVVRDRTRLVGHNTDAHGFAAATRDAGGASLFAGKRVLLLGSGGAARACASALADAREIRVANRTPRRAERLLRDLAIANGRVVPWPASAGALDVDAVVNATTLGLHGEDPLRGLPLPPCVVDIVPTAAETPLVARARRAHHTVVVDGLAMLLHQAARAFELWTGQRAPLEVMRAALPRRV